MTEFSTVRLAPKCKLSYLSALSLGEMHQDPNTHLLLVSCSKFWSLIGQMQWMQCILFYDRSQRMHARTFCVIILGKSTFFVVINIYWVNLISSHTYSVIDYWKIRLFNQIYWDLKKCWVTLVAENPKYKRGKFSS